MADVLTDRASLARAFYRLTATSSTNPALIEHDSTTLEAVYQFLQYGIWDAQEYMIDAGMDDRWLSTYTSLSTWTGSDSSNGGRYQSLPSDFLRLAGDFNDSALRYPSGIPWGRMIDVKDRYRHKGNCFYLRENNLWICSGANPPSNLQMEYYALHDTLADSTTIDFPSPLRALVVAFAADRAKNESWLPGDEMMFARIAANLRDRKREAAIRARQNNAPKKRRRRQSGASHYWK